MSILKELRPVLLVCAACVLLQMLVVWRCYPADDDFTNFEEITGTYYYERTEGDSDSERAWVDGRKVYCQFTLFGTISGNCPHTYAGRTVRVKLMPFSSLLGSGHVAIDIAGELGPGDVTRIDRHRMQVIWLVLSMLWLAGAALAVVVLFAGQYYGRLRQRQARSGAAPTPSIDPVYDADDTRRLQVAIREEMYKETEPPMRFLDRKSYAVLGAVLALLVGMAVYAPASSVQLYMVWLIDIGLIGAVMAAMVMGRYRSEIFRTELVLPHKLSYTHKLHDATLLPYYLLAYRAMVLFSVLMMAGGVLFVWV